MLQALKNILGIGPKVDLGELIAKGAIIVDVRTPGEYAGGHIRGSINIPVDQIGQQTKKLKSKDQVIITCCASGMRSGSAKHILKAKGYTHVHNGGSWYNLKAYEK
ncbi:MAG: rhodanese-like domain-containing protein [Bacteroidetes bacterium]|nr:rhodanese-like domain-containing protein [Bacteroidota bacterium]